MAAAGVGKMLQRRILSLFASNRARNLPPTEASQHMLPSASTLFSRHNLFERSLKTQAEAIVDWKKQVRGKRNTDKQEQESNDNSEGKYSVVSNLKTSSRHDLALVFTCKVCETRSVKTACRESYEKGVVVVRCSGCNNLHLIADRLGWFGEPGSVEDLLAARGEEIKKGSVDTLNLTLEDLAGTRN
ncbi:DNL-type zinc finger protein [Rhodamnia argentea]|uniref:DNL-type zinc finger protein n=1 Tax=Rhodamnia argentea TaxID=178133 RepID=A0A8B8QN88_9MYRT|nr:DNL-type zinc finger protein [Rhodamnia argentea]XP_048135516.1 DNL-type zinc finger protein [Rhodamnia argentea]